MAQLREEAEREGRVDSRIILTEAF